MGTTRGALLGAALLALVGCGSSKPEVSAPTAEEMGAEAAGEAATETADDTSADEGGGDAPSGKDAPEISRSGGEAGGVVVFWPRVVPRTEDPAIRELAGKLQKRLTDVVAKAVPDRKQDVRPEPERVCPKAGCATMTVGVLLTSKGGGCAAVALVSGPGKAPARLVPWAGSIELKAAEVPFREPPENSVIISDMVSCEKMLAGLDKQEPGLVEAIKKAPTTASP